MTEDTGTLSEIYTCPKCGGTGVLDTAQHEHEWRLYQSWNLAGGGWLSYVCDFPGCEATLCSDCLRDGRRTCGDNATPAASVPCQPPGEADKT